MSEQTSRQTEDTMATAQDLAVRDKKELVSKNEKTVPGRYYVPYADIYETDEVLSVVMESRASRERTSTSRWKTTYCASMGGSTLPNTKGWSRFIRSTTWATTRGPSRYQAKSIRARSMHSSTMVC
jgi:hypothetical protein